MNNRKATGYTLVSSIISVFLCIVMLIGTTFAWFTDVANTNINKIQSGELDLAITDDAEEDLEGKMLKWEKADGEEEILWEPNCTYKLQTVHLKNIGNLALKYKVIINGIDGDAKLLEVIDFTAKIDGEEVDLDEFEGTLLPDESEELVIAAHMDKDAGNEYQNEKIEGISITVKAAQLPYEYDSYDNQYDANAPYADDEADEQPTEPEDDTTAPEVPSYKTWLHRVSEREVNANKGQLGYTSTIFNNVDAGIITAFPAEYIGISESSSNNVKAILVLEEGAVVKKVEFKGHNLFKLSSGGKLVDNLSGGEVKLVISGKLKINNTEITTAEQLSDYLNNISDITFK